MTKQKTDDSWIRICLIPLLIGFSLVVTKITMIVFKVIGWVLLIWGLAIGSVYLFRLYKTHREEILKFLRKVYLIKEKTTEESKR